MNDDTLVAALAARLSLVVAHAAPVEGEWNLYDTLARECLRQMLWTQREGWEYSRFHLRRASMDAAPLTLAPDDWTP